MPLLQASYRFFDAPFEVHTDSSRFLAQIDRAYLRFRVDKTPGAPVYSLVLGREPCLALDGGVMTCRDPDALRDYAYHAIPAAAEARVRSHYLFHGAALAHPEGQGAILLGAAGLGKTTLTLALVEHGYRVLSDDVAAVRVGRPWIDPFPRRLGVRAEGTQSAEKTWIEIKPWAPACPARFLFVLTDAGEQPDDPYWYLCVDHIGEAWLAGLRLTLGVMDQQVLAGSSRPMVRLQLAPGSERTVLARVEELCREHGVLVFQVIHGRSGPPGFEREPSLTALSPVDAAHELLGHLRSGRRSAFLDAGDGSAARLFLGFVQLAATLKCYRLSVGRLEGSINLIQATMAGAIEGKGP